MTQVIRVPRTFVPGEAHSIAAGFRAQAGRARDLARQLRDVGGTLNTWWEGNAKNVFFSTFSSEPGNLESYASWLEDKARNIEGMTVTVWETKVVP
jgi:uncharacterized protein YukE